MTIAINYEDLAQQVGEILNTNYLKEIATTIYGESGVHFILPDWNSPYWEPHWHECMEITLVQRGVVSSTVDEKNYTISAGQVLIVPPTAIHGGSILTEDTLYRTIKVELSEFLNSTKATSKCINVFLERKIDFPIVTDNPEIVSLINDMLDANQNNQQFSIVASFYKFLSVIYTNSASAKSTNDTSDFFDVLQYIRENLCSPISTKDICKKFSYNETYFCRKFKKQTGLTVTRFILIHRLENVRHLMRSEPRPIGDICTECGFSDFSYFCAAFKKVYGISPAKYREMLKSTSPTHKD